LEAVGLCRKGEGGKYIQEKYELLQKQGFLKPGNSAKRIAIVSL
jgi:hypothetical protein